MDDGWVPLVEKREKIAIVEEVEIGLGLDLGLGGKGVQLRLLWEMRRCQLARAGSSWWSSQGSQTK